MVDKNEDVYPKHFVLPDFELVERLTNLKALGEEARKLHEQMRVLEKQLSANKEFQEKGLAKITSHMKARNKHREIVIVDDDKQRPLAALIEHQGFNMYPNAAVQVTFFAAVKK